MRTCDIAFSWPRSSRVGRKSGRRGFGRRWRRSGEVDVEPRGVRWEDVVRERERERESECSERDGDLEPERDLDLDLEREL